MQVADKYRLQRQIGWSDEAEVHSGPMDPTRRVPVAVKIRHGMGGPPRPDGNRARFLSAVNDQQAAVEAGCKQFAPIFESGHEGDDAFYVTRHYQRSLDSLIQGRVTLEPAALQKITAGVLQALEELRDKRTRAHGNLKPTNVFLDGKSVPAATVVLSDIARPEDAPTQGADCYALGTVLVQLVRERTIRNFDWPIEPSDDWASLGPQADAWREYCNVLMSPELSAHPEALATARKAFKGMRNLPTVASRRPGGSVGAGVKVAAPAGRGGLWTGVAVLAALGVFAATLLVPAADSKLGRQFRGIGALAGLYRLVDPTPAPGGTASPAPATDASSPEAGATPALVQAAPPSDAGQPTPAAATPAPTVAVVEATPAPTPPPTPNVTDKWVRYVTTLQGFQGSLNDPALLDQPEMLNFNLTRLKDDIGFSPVKDEPTVRAFLKVLPTELKATGDQPDLPGDLWIKEGTTRQGDVQSVTYQWGRSGYRLAFNRVPAPGGNGPAFYLAATTVPVQFGAVLAKRAEGDGKGPLSGAASVRGPVAWEYVRGTYAPRQSWLVLDAVNAPFYANAGRPSYDHPLNGISGIEAVRLARAAGCALPTLAQWSALLASPAGQEWAGQWQTAAKVRGPQWAAFAKGIQNQHITGAKLPNDQCFGDRNDLNAVGQNGDQNWFFEPVTSRLIRGYAQLIGNVGQYVVDDARNPTKYYFAGGSAEAAPSAFQSLGSPPVVGAPFVAAADGGLRLAVAAKGSGSDKNPALDDLKKNLKAELARAEKLQ